MIVIRKASEADLQAIKNLADREKYSLGFTRRSALEEGIRSGSIFVAEVDSQVIGFQQYYHRKSDLITTLYRKTVAHEWRNKGIGSLLVDAVVEEARQAGKELLRLKCPVDNPSNKFHQDYGFVLVRVDPGRRRKLNVYEYRIRSEQRA